MININERFALAKLSEHLTSMSIIKRDEIIWLSNVFDIKEYQDISKQVIILPTENVSKEILFNFFFFVYVDYPNIFSRLIEEILQNFIKSLLLKIVEKVQQEKEEMLVKIIKNSISRDLEILEYEMHIDLHLQTIDFLTLQLISREISNQRKMERVKLFNTLEKNFRNEYESLKGAYERYSEGGSDAYRQAKDSCRNAYENFFKNITKTEKWKEKLKKSSLSATLISLIKEVYKYLSGYGTHSPKQRKKEDAFLAIRVTEDILMRVLMEKNLW